MKPKTLFYSSLIAAAAMSTVPAWAVSYISSYDSENKKINWYSADNAAYKWVGSSSGAFATASNWVSGTGLNGTPTWSDTNTAPARVSSGDINYGYLLYFDGTSQTISVSGGTGTGNDGVDSSDGGGIWVTGTGNTVTASLGGWAGSIQVDAGNVLNTSWSQKLKDGHIVANGTVNITSGNLNFDGSGERTWFVGADGSITFGTATGISNGTITLLGEVDTLDSSTLTNRTASDTETLTKQLVTFSAGVISGRELLSVSKISDAVSGTELTAATSADSLTAGQYYADKSSSGVTVYYAVNTYTAETLTWAGTDSDTVWANKGDNWTNASNVKTSFLNGDSVIFGSGTTNIATISENLTVGTMTVSAATTLSGTGTVSVTSGLTLDADLTLDSGVTLSAGTLGSAGALYDATHVKGTGTFGFSAVASGNGSGINLSNFSGEVYLKGGLLELGDASFTSSLGSGALRVASGAHLVFNGTGTNVSNDITFEGNSTIHANSGKNGTLSGNVSSTGTLTKNGAGTLTIEGTANIGTLISSVSDGVTNISGEGTSISDLRISAGSVNITAGEATIKGDKSLVGNLTIGGNATVKVGQTDSLKYDVTSANTITVNEGGTLDLGSCRWTVGSNNKIVLNGGTITGTGDNTGAALDFYRSGTVTANTTSEISANVKIRKDTATHAVETFSIGTGVKLLISGNVIGAGDIIKAGNGTLELSGTNTFTGGVTVSAGTLALAGTNTYTGNLTVSAGTLEVAGKNTFTGNLTVSAGALEVASSGSLTLSGTSTLNGSVTVDSGATLDLSGGTVSLASAISNSGTVTVNSSTVFVLADTLKTSDTDSATTYTLITNTDSGSITDWNTLTISNFRQADGTAFSARSSVDVTTDGVATITSVVYNLFWNGGDSGTWNTTKSNTIWVNKNPETGDATASFDTGDNVTFGTSGATVTLGEAIYARTVSVTENTTLAATSANTLSAESISVSAGKTLTLSGGYTNFSWSSASLAEGSVLDLGSGGDTIGTSSSKLALSGTGTVKYSFTSTDAQWGGGTGSGIYISDDFAGTVDYTGCLNYGTNISIGSNATLKLSSRTGESDVMWGPSSTTIANKIIFATDYGLNIGSGTLTLSGEISGTGTITKTNSGTLILTNANFLNGTSVFAPKMIVSAGTLQFGSGSTIAIAKATESDGGIEVGSGATLYLSGGSSAHHSIAKDITLNDGASLKWNDASQASAASYQHQFTGTLTVNGSAVITGVSNWAKEVALLGNLSGSGTLNYYRGAGDSAFNSNGRLIIAGADNSGFTGTVLIGGQSTAYSQGLDLNADLANGTISLQGNTSQPAYMRVLKSATIKGLNGNANSSIGIGNVLAGGAVGNYTLTVGEGTFAGTIEDNGYARQYGATSAKVSGATLALVKNTTGTLTLSGNNTFTGGVTLSAGTLELGHNNALGDATSTLEVTGSSTLTLGSGLNVANTIASHGGGLTLTLNSAGDAELSGVLAAYYSGTTEVKKTGAGTLTLSGDNSAFMHGTISVEAGTLLAKSANALGTVTTATDNAVRLSGGTLKVGAGVTLAQTNITIALSDAYKTSAAITGEDGAALADGTKISIISIGGGADIAVATIAVSTVSSQYNYKIADTILGGSLKLSDFSLSSDLQDEGWKIAAYSSDSGVLTLTIPEPSTFGLLAGVGALALVAARRRRRAK